MLAGDEDADFDTPVERVADPKRDGLRDRIASRTAAMRGESTGESEASVPTGGAEPEGVPTPPSGGSSAPKGGDPWMRRLHAVAAEWGMDHAGLHDWAVEHFGVESLSDLSIYQRATFMELVERMEVMPTSAPREADDGAAGGSEPAASTTPQSVVGSPASATPEAGDPPSASPPVAQPTFEDVLRVSGGVDVTPPPKGGRTVEEAIADAESKAKKAKAKS
jgi:hypothetical protein